MEEVQTTTHIHMQLRGVAALCNETASQEGISQQVKKGKKDVQKHSQVLPDAKIRDSYQSGSQKVKKRHIWSVTQEEFIYTRNKWLTE